MEIKGFSTNEKIMYNYDSPSTSDFAFLALSCSRKMFILFTFILHHQTILQKFRWEVKKKRVHQRIHERVEKKCITYKAIQRVLFCSFLFITFAFHFCLFLLLSNKIKSRDGWQKQSENIFNIFGASKKKNYYAQQEMDSFSLLFSSLLFPPTSFACSLCFLQFFDFITHVQDCHRNISQAINFSYSLTLLEINSFVFSKDSSKNSGRKKNCQMKLMKLKYSTLFIDINPHYV